MDRRLGTLRPRFGTHTLPDTVLSMHAHLENIINFDNFFPRFPPSPKGGIFIEMIFCIISLKLGKVTEF